MAAAGLRASAPDRPKIVEAARHIKMAAPPRPIIRAYGNGRRHPSAKPRRVWDTGNGIDAHTAADSLAAVRLAATGAAEGAGHFRARGRTTCDYAVGEGLLSGLEIASPDRLATTNPGGGGKTTD